VTRKNAALHLTPVVFAALVMLAAPALAAGKATINDTARYLAGLKPSANSPLMALTRERSWITHARTLDQAWKRIEKAQLSKIRAWSNKHLTRRHRLMLYMFSGPDFLYADAFYPDASVYVLSALEPVGPLPDAARLSSGARAGGLQHLRASMQSVLSFSFFKTKQMKSDLGSGVMRGTLPLLYVFMARAGKTIQDVELIRLNPDGTISPRGRAAAKGRPEGVKIVFSGKTGPLRTLYYFRTDLSNGGLRKSGLRPFAESFGAAGSLVKSASYLLHNGSFKVARDFLLKHSATIVQDPSGIPVRHFSKKTWRLTPFGKYRGPIDLFAEYYQPAMKPLFARGRAQPINFGIGYRWRTYETSVLLAVKRSALTTTTVD